jgi:chemotaxis signal transduction protein
MSGYVTFMMGGREMAGRLLEVREVVRAVGVEPLAGSRAPVTGLLILRELPLPVVDLRSEADPGDVGDVLVLVPDAVSYTL